MASSTSSHGSSKSVPSIFSNDMRPSATTCSTSWARRARTRPSSSPRKHSVLTENTRSPPSSWADDVRKMSGHVGHGVLSGRCSGGSAGSWSSVAGSGCS